jgi:hypothetical protein
LKDSVSEKTGIVADATGAGQAESEYRTVAAIFTFSNRAKLDLVFRWWLKLLKARRLTY